MKLIKIPFNKYINFTTHTPAKQQQAVTSRTVIGLFVSTLSVKDTQTKMEWWYQDFNLF